MTLLIVGSLTLGACSSPTEDDTTSAPSPGAGADSPGQDEPTPTASPSSDAETPTASPSSDAGTTKGGKATVVKAKVIDTDFVPVKITVDAGTTVAWTQIGDQPHSVSSVDDVFDSSPNCGPLDTDSCLSEGSEFEFTFEDPGTYDYYCRVHGLPDGTGMFGTVVVK